MNYMFLLKRDEDYSSSTFCEAVKGNLGIHEPENLLEEDIESLQSKVPTEIKGLIFITPSDSIKKR